MAQEEPKTSMTRAARGKRRSILTVLAVLMLAALAVAALRGHSYARHEQRFCSDACHAPKDGSPVWHTSGHQDVPCQTCHATPARTSYALLWKKLTGGKDLPAHGKVTVGDCTSCHEKDPVAWRLTEATEGHRSHRGVKDVDCFSCHADNAHNKGVTTEQLCLKCHEPARLHRLAENAETCLSCHNFSAPQRRTGTTRAMACAGCHADESKVSATATRVVNEDTVHGGLDCKLCHDPHPHTARKTAAAAPLASGAPAAGGAPATPAPTAAWPAPAAVCSRCHRVELQKTVEGKPELKGHKDCAGCHTPHATRKHALDSCVKCHETRVKGLTQAVAALPFGSKRGVSALRHESCASCHLPHTWRAEPGGCVTCHNEQAVSIQTKSPAAHNDCAQCHDVHGPPPTVLVCIKCHGPTKQSHLTTAPGRHKDCLGCHDPHGATKTAARDTCAGCHTAALAQLASHDAPRKHLANGCLGCHKPHDNPRPSADLCAQCHADKGKLVASAQQPKHKACASCHKEHRFAIKDIAGACASCHTGTVVATTPAGLSEGTHKGACKDCHTLHGNATVSKAACFACHKPIQAAFKPPAGNEQHAQCRSCHTPHQPAAQATANCRKCHEKQVTVAATWPAKSAHAQACQGCHQPHDVKSKKACADCHAQEATSALGGKHQCAQCHAPHQATPGTGPAWWSKCGDCHAAQVTGAKTRGPKHSDCKNCHQPHRFSPPTCASCHADVPQKALHAVKGHAAAKCDACHDAHAKAEPNRGQCLACHTNKLKHEPEAQKCQACHPFR
jgi:hypothetical protein